MGEQASIQVLETLRAPDVQAAVELVAMELVRRKTLNSTQVHSWLNMCGPVEREPKQGIGKMIYKQKTSKYWWFKFAWNGDTLRESTKQTNKRVAEQMEAARRTALAKGEVGIRDRKPAPTLADFADKDFLPFVRTTSAGKPNTVRFYENSVKNLKAETKLSGLRMDAITSENISAFVAKRQAGNVEVSTSTGTWPRCAECSTCARVGQGGKGASRVKLLAGENRRERVLLPKRKQPTWKRPQR